MKTFKVTQNLRTFIHSFLVLFAALNSGQVKARLPLWDWDYKKIPSYHSKFVTLIPIGPYELGEDKIWDTARLFAQVGSVNPYFSEIKIMPPSGREAKSLHEFFENEGLLILPACRHDHLAPVFLEEFRATSVTLVGNTIIALLEGSENCETFERFTEQDKISLDKIHAKLPKNGDYSKYNFSLAPGAGNFMDPFGASPKFPGLLSPKL